MELGFIGLGRMGGNMVRRLARDHHHLIVYDQNPAAGEALAREMLDQVQPAASLPALVQALQPPRSIWLMVPAGEPVDQTLAALMDICTPGDVFVDGGNSNFKDSVRRAAQVAQRGFHFLDAGTSGGIWGLQMGYCLMVGGDPAAFARLEPAFRSLAPANGYLHVGPSGAGHFVKMVHNGIEYGLMQAYAEGFEVLHAAGTFGYDFDLHAIAGLWNQGSVIRSWLLELAERAFAADPRLDDIRGYVEDTGEGRWTVLAAIEENVPAMAIALALMTRFRSRQAESFGAKVLAALRHEFGGHAVRPADGEASPTATP
jgi:6-phosphogluconate dehydrogenase